MNLRTLCLSSVALGLSLGTLACASDEQQIEKKVAAVLEQCRTASGDTHEVTFSSGKPYIMDKALCEAPIGGITITEKVKGEATSGPYVFKLGKNPSDGRWNLVQVRWPAYDKGMNIFTFDNISETDYIEADKALAQAESLAPAKANIKERRLQIALAQRKAANKQAEPVAKQGTLGKAQTYYDKAIAAAKAQKNTNLEASLRLQVLEWYDNFRKKAVGGSTVSESAAEYDQGSIKAVENELKDAKAKKDEALIKKKEAEIAMRTKEAEENIGKRIEAAKRMKALADVLTVSHCKEIKAAKALSPTDADLRGKISDATGVINCP